MQTGWRKRLLDIIDGTDGLTMKALSKKAGLAESALHDYLKRGRAPSVDNFIAIAHAAGVTPAQLLQGDDRFIQKVPLIGTVSTGETWKATEAAKPQAVEFELGDYDVITLEVRGDGMAPAYRDQDVLFCHRRTGRFLQNLIGLDCVIRTTKGENYLKILQAGTRPGTFNLRSYNPVVKDIPNVSIEWAAPIVWIKRGGL